MDCSTPGFPVPSLSPGACSNSCPSSRWCHPTISSSVSPFSSCLQSFPASGSFPMSQFLHQVAKVLEFQLQHQSFQWIFRTDFLWDWLVGSPASICPKGLSFEIDGLIHSFYEVFQKEQPPPPHDFLPCSELRQETKQEAVWEGIWLCVAGQRGFQDWSWFRPTQPSSPCCTSLGQVNAGGGWCRYDH